MGRVGQHGHAPQVTGRISRHLPRFISRGACGFGDVWIANGEPRATFHSAEAATRQRHAKLSTETCRGRDAGRFLITTPPWTWDGDPSPTVTELPRSDRCRPRRSYHRFSASANGPAVLPVSTHTVLTACGTVDDWDREIIYRAFIVVNSASDFDLFLFRVHLLHAANSQYSRAALKHRGGPLPTRGWSRGADRSWGPSYAHNGACRW